MIVMTSEPKKEIAEKDAKPARYSKEKFLADSREFATGENKFEVVEKRLVRIYVDDFVWIKRGTVIAYHGDLKFRRENVFQSKGVGAQSGSVQGAVKREIVPLAKAEGKGTLYISDDGGHTHVVRLEGDSVYVVSSNLLAFDPKLNHEVLMVGGVGVLAGGIFVIKISGHGEGALSVKGDPLTLRVTPDDPISTDPTATVAWTGSLWPELKTDVEMLTLVAHGGGESIQMLFRGEGLVIVHARSRLEAMRSGVINRVTSKGKKLLGL
jgi:uncharacterized protein (AIM24 family)